MILLSVQGMDPTRIAEVTFTSSDRVRDVIHNFNTDGFDSLYPQYRGGRAPTFSLPQRREMKKIAKSKPAEHGLPFSTWSLAKLAHFRVRPRRQLPQAPGRAVRVVRADRYSWRLDARPFDETGAASASSASPKCGGAGMSSTPRARSWLCMNWASRLR